jgi:hypothetical protein
MEHVTANTHSASAWKDRENPYKFSLSIGNYENEHLPLSVPRSSLSGSQYSYLLSGIAKLPLPNLKTVRNAC